MFKKVPDTLVIITSVLALFVLLTWIIPAGQFERKQILLEQVVVPGSYKPLPQVPQGIGAFFMAPVKGFASAAQIIAFVLFIGGAFGVLNKTGAMENGLKKLISYSFKHPSYQKLFIPVLMVVFSIFGATFGMCEEGLVFVLLTIPIALALGYDSIVGVSIPFIGAGVGFAGAISNPFTIGIAQGICEVPIFSGWEYRIFVWLILTIAAVVFISMYAKKIKLNPTLSPVYHIDKERNNTFDFNSKIIFRKQDAAIIFSFFMVIICLVVGVNIWQWHINEISALFISLGLIAAIIARLEMQQSIDAFMEGAKEMLPAAFVIAFSKGILIIITEGKIIDTILFQLSEFIQGMPPIVSVQMMFYIQSIIHVLVPSGSGQAALSMPIMGPLSDLVGITRQTTVLIFQLGDGINSMIIPTSGVTMGILSVAKIPYQKWIKWIWPLMLILFALSMLLLVPPVSLFYYGPR